MAKKCMFVQAGGLPASVPGMMLPAPNVRYPETIGLSFWTVESFKKALLERNVCPISVASNAAQYLSEIQGAGVSVDAYLRKVDCRTKGGLLHQAALIQLLAESQ